VEVEIWPFRACAMHPAIIIGTVRSLWTSFGLRLSFLLIFTHLKLSAILFIFSKFGCHAPDLYSFVSINEFNDLKKERTKIGKAV